MKKVILLLSLALVAAGCGGEAEVTFINNSGSYIHGDIDGRRWGMPPNGSATRTIDVGGYVRRTEEVDLNTYWHKSWDYSSEVTGMKYSTMELEIGYSYTHEYFFNPETGKIEARALQLGPYTNGLIH